MKTSRTQVKRNPQRGSYDSQEIYAILDAARICHLAFVADQQPYAIPTIHTRIGNTLYVHGAPASRMLKTLAGMVPVCLTATLVDGLVFAKSAFHHSMNYRSVVVLGNASTVDALDEKRAALRSFVEDIAPGRYDDCRQANDKEVQSTTVLRIPIEEASAKCRTGGPIDDPADMKLDHWSGVLPLQTAFGPAIPVMDGIPIPDYLRPLLPNSQ